MSQPVAMNKYFVCLSALLLGLLGLLAGGCGDSTGPTGTVQGKVLLGETPYTDASVVLLDPQTGQAGSADIQPDGSFTISTPLPTGTYTAFLAPESAGETPNGQPQPVTIDESVPEKYWNESTSDIQVEVNEGMNNVTIQLKK